MIVTVKAHLLLLVILAFVVFSIEVDILGTVVHSLDTDELVTCEELHLAVILHTLVALEVPAVVTVDDGLGVDASLRTRTTVLNKLNFLSSFIFTFTTLSVKANIRVR